MNDVAWNNIMVHFEKLSQGQLIHLLQHAVSTNSYDAYKKYTQGIYDLPTINLRDLLAFKNLG